MLWPAKTFTLLVLYEKYCSELKSLDVALNDMCGHSHGMRVK